MQTKRKASLILDDGTVFEGKSFGYEKPVAGEVVFNTAMMGYPESLTDPSYSGQILVTTYPLIGNYGVPRREEENGLSRFYESEKIHVEALVVSDYSFEYSHWNANKSLADWLKEEKIVGIYDIDTRELTKLLRVHGSMKGKIVFEDGEDIDFVDPNLTNLVAKVSCKEVIRYGNGNKKVVLVDCGVKHNIARTYKLKYGHRSHNQPVRQVGTNRCFITSQNHGFAVDNSTLGSDWEPLFINMNDSTNEGIRHKSKPYFSAQFHPEATRSFYLMSL